ncbi:MAG: energy-coupling factor transporter ATPase [Eubacterium sp.]|nr:energy-coupling factor transporter ATPase [Eubacterium sp.]
MSLRLEHINYIYNPGTVYEKYALQDVSLSIGEGEFLGMIGHTGSGKSTLIQHLNGLIRPTSGTVFYNDEDIWADKYDRQKLRFHVGLVFQYPEYQLFESDVLKDVCFGPKNMGLSSGEQKERAVRSLRQVGIPEEDFSRSPFDFSGGMKRRIAIAGVLAMDPDVLVLDEPTAGLDPYGRDEILNCLSELHEDRGITIVLVSHSMDDMARYAKRLIVMDHGKKVFDAPPREVFSHIEELEGMGLAAPQMTYILRDLKEKGYEVDISAGTVEEARDTILAALAGRKKAAKG